MHFHRDGGTNERAGEDFAGSATGCLPPVLPARTITGVGAAAAALTRDGFERVKRFNPRRVKLHRNYTVGEAAMLLEVHKNTIRAWLGSGLEAIDDRRPVLILGRKLSAFLHARRESRRQRCKAGQLYCVRCRAPKTCRGTAWPTTCR